MPFEDPLKRYQIMESLGQGGQGCTYRGIDRDTHRDVAIKVVSLKSMRAWKAFDLFEREVEVLKSLDHPGIPKYFDNYASEQSGDFFLVMELIPGTSLQQYVSGEKRMKPKQVRDLLLQALDILDYLHCLAPPILHRDVKPSNFVLRPNGKLALVDFGGVRHVVRTDGASTVVGTFGYMAPEQLHGDATAATDLYGLGATIVALATGIRGEDLPHDGLAIDLAALPIPAKLAPALTAMLQPEPGKRLRSVAAVRKVLSGQPPPGAKGPTAQPQHGSARHGPRLVAPGGALVKLPVAAKQLAKVRGPFAIVIWLFAAIAAGAVLVFEAALLPIFYRIIVTLHNRRADDPRQHAFEADYRRFKSSVKRTRTTLSFVADGTRPKT